MKPCRDTHGAAIYVRRAATVHNPLFNIHTSVEYLTGTFLLVSCSNF